MFIDPLSIATYSRKAEPTSQERFLPPPASLSAKLSAFCRTTSMVSNVTDKLPALSPFRQDVLSSSRRSLPAFL